MARFRRSPRALILVTIVVASFDLACDSGPRPIEASRPAPKADGQPNAAQPPANTTAQPPAETHAQPAETQARPAVTPSREPAITENRRTANESSATPPTHDEPQAPPTNANPPPGADEPRRDVATSQPPNPAGEPATTTGPFKDDRPPDFLSIVERIDANRGFRATSEIKSPSRLSLTTDNIRRLRIDLRKLPFDRKRSTALLIDGQGIELTGKHNVVELVRSRNGDWSPAQPVEAP